MTSVNGIFCAPAMCPLRSAAARLDAVVEHGGAPVDQVEIGVPSFATHEGGVDDDRLDLSARQMSRALLPALGR